MSNQVQLSGVPGAMCTYQNKLYLFFDKAYQTLSFEGGKLNSSSGLASWEKPTNCVAQDEYIWIAAGNGLFTLHFDGDKHKILHADPQGWADVRGLGIYKDNLYAVSKDVKQLDTSTGIIKQINSENWGNMVYSAQNGKYLFMPSKAGPIWRFDMETDKYDSVSHGWSKAKAATFVDDQLFIFADGIFLVDLDGDKKRQIRKEDCGDVVLCSAIGRDVYVVKKDATFWKYNLDVTEAKIDLEWTAKTKVEPTQVQPQIQEISSQQESMAAISFYNNGMSHRLYKVENGKVVEYGQDANGNWYKGKFPETPGTKVAAVNWEGLQFRIYIQQGDSVVEVAHDGGWKTGAFKAKGNLVSASVVGPNVHVWVENNGALVEHYWGNGWEERPVKV